LPHAGYAKYRFLVENIDARLRTFPVNQQRHTEFLHHVEHFLDLARTGHTVFGMRRCSRRIEFHCSKDTLAETSADFLAIGVVAEVGRHQWFETCASGHSRQNALPIGARRSHSRDRRLEVRHDDRAAELANGIRQHGTQRILVTQV